MKDIQTPLRTMFFDKIIGMQYRCYEAGAIPDDAVTPYVIIADMSSNENSNKTGFGNTVQTLIDIVTSFEKNKIGGSKLVDSMANIIIGQINSKIKLNITDDLQIVNTKILQDQKIVLSTAESRIYRRLIRFQQLIMEV